MAVKISTCFIIFVLICTGSLQAVAQEKKPEKKKSPYHVVLLPEFYQYTPVVKKDTTYRYECYDYFDKRVNVDLMKDISAIDNITYTKNYYQFPNTGKNPVSPPYLTHKIYLYERNDDGTWIAIDQRTNIKTGFKENKSKIVRSDTVIVTNPVTGAKQPTIHKYFKLINVDMKTVKPHKD